MEIKIKMRQQQCFLLATLESILSSNDSRKLPKNFSKFNVSVQKKFRFLKTVASSESEVLCTLCGKLSVADGERTRINGHIKTQKHIKAWKTVTTNQSIAMQCLTRHSCCDSLSLKISRGRMKNECRVSSDGSKLLKH